MQSPKLEHVKARHVGVASLLDRLAEYVERQSAAKQSFVVPKLVGAALGISDGESYVLMEMMAESELLKRQYNVYCRKEGVLLTSVDSIEALNDIPSCDFCDSCHAPDELVVEVAFRQVGAFRAPDKAA